MADTETEKIAKKIITKAKKPKKSGKIAKLTSTIISLSIILIILISSTFFIFQNFIKSRENLSLEINNLRRKEQSLINQIADLESQSANAQRYITMWREEFTEAQKSKNGISIDLATELLKNISKNHNVTDLQITFSSPAVLSGIFDRQSIRVSSTLITMRFNTITDINVLNFIQDIEKQIPNFMILTELKMTRTRKINEEYFDLLKRGNIVPTLKVELRIRWYGISSIND